MLVIFSFTEEGTRLNQRLCEALGSEQAKGCAPAGLVAELAPLPEKLSDWIRQRWGKDDFLFIGAAGIAVRMIAPSVQDKYTDSAVLVMDEKAGHVIPLLSGHVGGGIRLAKWLAEYTGAEPVITTATDVQHKFAVDVFAEAHHLEITDRNLARALSAAVLRGETLGAYAEPGYEALREDLEKEAEEYPELRVCDTIEALAEYSHGICLTKHPAAEMPGVLTLRIPEIVIGVGCRRGTDREVLHAGILEVLGRHGLSVRQVKAMVSIDLKRQEPGLLALAELWRIPFFTYTAEQIAEAEDVSSRSAFVRRTTGVDNVCEGAVRYYLKGQGGRVIQEKCVQNGVTVSLGEVLRNLSENDRIVTDVSKDEH